MPQTVSFSCSLYSEESLLAAVEAYREIARIEVSKEPHQLTAAFHSDEPVEDDVLDEFANFVLAEMITRRTSETAPR